MDSQHIMAAARDRFPFLDWIGSTDGDGTIGSGLPFVAATVGTTMGPATLCLSWVGGHWLAELNITRAGLKTEERKQRTLLVQTAGARSAGEAFDDITELTGAAASFADGLDVARVAWEKTDAGRLSKLGLVSPGGSIL